MKRRMGRVRAGRSIPRAVALGSGLALVVSLILAALAAAAISRQWIPESGGVYAGVVILIGGACGGAWFGGRQAPSHRFSVSMGIAGGYFAGLLLLGALCFGGRFRGIPVTAALILGSAGAMALLGLRQGKGRKWKYKRYGL